MGYYSFYKIIKDIIRTIFNKKVLYIFLLVVFILSLFSYFNKSFGADVNTDELFDFNISFDEELFGDTNYIMYLYNQSGYLGVDLYVSNYEDFNRLSTGNSTGYTVTIPSGYLYTERQGELGRISNLDSSTASTALNNFITACMNNYNSQNPSTSSRVRYINKRSNYGSGSFYSNKSIYVGNNVIFEAVVPPELLTPIQNLQTLSFDNLSIKGNSYSDQDFDVLLYDLNYGSDTTEGLYPQKIITLNKDTYYYNNANSTLKNYVYWIPIDELGLKFFVGGKYAIKFAIRDYYNAPQGGGGFRESANYIYDYIGDTTIFTISSDVSNSKIDSLNNAIKEDEEKKRHDETMGGLNNIDNSINNMNNFFNDSNVDNTTNEDISGSFDYDKSNEQLEGSYNGFMSRFMALLAGLYDYDLNTVDTIEIPLPYVTKKIVLYSNIISSHLGDPLKSLIIAFWMYLFYFYGYKFLSYMLVQIQEGKILDSSNSDNTVGTLPTSLL